MTPTARTRAENLLGVSLMRAAYGAMNPRVAIRAGYKPHHNPQARQQLYLQAVAHNLNQAANHMLDWLETRRSEMALEAALRRISVDETASPRK